MMKYDNEHATFCIIRYPNHYTLLIFERQDVGCLIEYDWNEMFTEQRNLFCEPPIERHKFDCKGTLFEFINEYFEIYIKFWNEDEDEKQNRIALDDIEIKQSAAILLSDWEYEEYCKTKLIPVIKYLLNGHRFNRTLHMKKLRSALKENQIIQTNSGYVIHW